MAKVFTGKDTIPGNQLDQYLAALEAEEKAREPFRHYLEQLSREFHHYLRAH